jgi:hypothetical protein
MLTAQIIGAAFAILFFSPLMTGDGRRRSARWHVTSERKLQTRHTKFDQAAEKGMGVPMADKKGLQIIGFIFGAITVAVISIAAVGIVNAGDSQFDDAQRPVALTSALVTR